MGGDQTEKPSPLRSQFAKLPFQGPDPLEDEHIGLKFCFRFGGGGFTPYPAFVGDFLRRRVWPLVLNEPATDSVFMDRAFLWTTVLLPLWIYLMLVADYTNSKLWFAGCYAVFAVLWFDQFVTYVLGLHCVVHRNMFKPNAVGKATRWFFVGIIGPMMGQTPETYGAHHVSMHHPLNNGYDDLSTTLTFKRDGGWDFARYLFGFLFATHYGLYESLQRRNPIVCQRFVVGECCWIAAGAVIYWYRPFGAALLYALPVLILRLGMTAGHWGQHSFLNPADPFANTNLSTTIVNSMYNRVSFNDGYHIQHHEYPNAPYYELPLLFMKMLPDLAKNDSIVFDAKGGLGDMFDWVSVWWLLVSGNYDSLADHFVDCRAIVNKTAPRSKQEIVALLKSRTATVFSRETTPPPKNA